jgi:hypothetical protein
VVSKDGRMQSVALKSQFFLEMAEEKKIVRHFLADE